MHTHTGCMEVSGGAVSRMHANRPTTNGCIQYSQYSAVVLLQGQKNMMSPEEQTYYTFVFSNGISFLFQLFSRLFFNSA